MFRNGIGTNRKVKKNSIDLLLKFIYQGNGKLSGSEVRDINREFYCSFRNRFELNN